MLESTRFGVVLATVGTLLTATSPALAEATDALVGTWIGGIETTVSDENPSADLLLARLQFVRAGDALEGAWAMLDRPGDVSGTIDTVTESDGTFAFSAIGATVTATVDGDVLTASFAWQRESGVQERSGRWTRMANVEPSALRRHAGTYHFASGAAFRIDPAAGYLSMLDVNTGTFRNLYPRSADVFFFGADFERPLPAHGEVVFAGGRATFRNGGERTDLPVGVARKLAPLQRPVEWHVDGDTGRLLLSPSVAMTFRRVGPGTFDMGERLSTEALFKAFGLDKKRLDDPSVHDRHHGLLRRVTLTKGFFMGQFEVTYRQFAAFVAATGYITDAERRGWGMRWTHDGFRRKTGLNWRSPGYATQPEHPVTMVTWFDAMAFADWLQEVTGIVFRLPTEAEWEYAARAGSESLFDYGDDTAQLAAYAHFGHGEDEDRWFPIPVGRKRPNRWGFHDMQGNVWEWTLDRGGDLPAEPATDPRGPEDGPGRILRGGSWINGPFSLRLASRPHDDPHLKEPHFGFRLVAEDASDGRNAP